MRVSADAKELIRRRVDLVDLVGRYTKLRRAGRDFKARCPLPGHEEKTPSFIVHPHEGYFKCFGCQRGGDALSFVMFMEGLSFPDALRWLAEQYHIELPTGDPSAISGPAGPRRPPGEREALLAALRFARDFYRGQLQGEAGAEARRYLRERGLTEETADRFALGRAPPAWDGLLVAASAEGHRAVALEQAGLVRRHRSGSGYFDFFRGRLMFPIHDRHDRPIGFSGRLLGPPQEGVGKYVNTPETELFHKGEVLYAFGAARRAIQQAGEALIVEGQMDALMAHQHGFAHTVAPLGTALTEAQVRLLARTADRAVLVFDPDEAGQKSAEGKLELFFRAELDVTLATLPGADDPADLLQREGTAAFAAAVADRRSALAFQWARIVGDRAGDAALRTRGAHALLALVAECADPLRQEAYVADVAALTRLSAVPLLQQLAVLRRRRARRAAEGDARRANAGAGTDAAGVPRAAEDGGGTDEGAPADAVLQQRRERELLALLVATPELALAARARLAIDRLRDPRARALLDVLAAPAGPATLRAGDAPLVAGAAEPPNGSPGGAPSRRPEARPPADRQSETPAPAAGAGDPAFGRLLVRLRAADRHDLVEYAAAVYGSAALPEHRERLLADCLAALEGAHQARQAAALQVEAVASSAAGDDLPLLAQFAAVREAHRARGQRTTRRAAASPARHGAPAATPKGAGARAAADGPYREGEA